MNSLFSITPNEYHSFISDFSLMLVSQKTYLNDVILRGGIPFPYDTEEFYTTVQFREGAMYLINVVEEEYATYKLEYPEWQAPENEKYSIKNGW